MMSWFIVLMVGFMVFPKPAQAYLDPGNGSMILQLLLAGFAGVVVGVKVFWRRIVAFFSRSKDR